MNTPARKLLSTMVAAAVSDGCLLGSAALAQDVPPPAPGTRDYSPYPEKKFPDRVYFGDTHLHTSYSTDAGMVGNRLGPDEAYRFEAIGSVAAFWLIDRTLNFVI